MRCAAPCCTLSPSIRQRRWRCDMIAAHTDDTALESTRRLTILDQFFVSCFWFAYNVQWGALLAIVLPSQIAAIVGDADKEFYNGLILPIGALVSLLITPVAGALSDRSRSRWGRRRPYMLVGTLINVLFL